MQIRNALQLKNGKKSKDEDRGFNSFTQPIQFLSRDEKDMDWATHNLDWLEWQGIKQISNNARKLMKNYKLAKGTIDREDYVQEEGAPTDVSELVDILSNATALQQEEKDAEAPEAKRQRLVRLEVGSQSHSTFSFSATRRGYTSRPSTTWAKNSSRTSSTARANG